ncbi:hypothetical protein BV20DRAFT_1052812 [Pilatotrama ljubarskyi]|nr:hypothetical protein BV20DRAFT_1052812 [Pilatotrama ljubarskyi]
MATNDQPTSRIPVEVWELIASPLRIRDLPALLLSSKHLNEALTPILYSHIQLNDAASAKMCIATLVADAGTLYLQRDLAGMVHAFCLNSFDLSSARRRDDEAAESLLPFTPSLLAALFRGAASTLQALHIELQTRKDWLSIQGSEGEIPDDFRPTCPELTVLDVWLKPMSQVCGESSFRFLQRLLASHAAQVRTLAFVSSGNADWVSFILGATTRWPVLERLEIDKYTLWEDVLQDTPEVRVLAVRGGHYPLSGLSVEDNREDDEVPMDTSPSGALQRSLPRTAFPKLEELHCAHDLLSAFLSPDDQLRRPIRTIELDGAYFWGIGRLLDFTIIPPWRAVRRALTHLPNSSGPVKELAFAVCGLDFERFVSSAGPYLRTLERLLLVMHASPVHPEVLEHFGERLLAQMPHLHTFLLSEGPYNPGAAKPSLEYCGDSNQQLRWLERWEVHAPALTTVCFTSDQMWTKTQRGWEAGVTADTLMQLNRSAQRTSWKSSIVSPLAGRLQGPKRMSVPTVTVTRLGPIR